MLHPDVEVFPYSNPSFRAVHGLPPLLTSLHRLTRPDGTIHLVAMRADQCNAQQQRDQCECFPWSQQADS